MKDNIPRKKHFGSCLSFLNTLSNLRGSSKSGLGFSLNIILTEEFICMGFQRNDSLFTKPREVKKKIIHTKVLDFILDFLNNKNYLVIKSLILS